MYIRFRKLYGILLVQQHSGEGKIRENSSPATSTEGKQIILEYTQPSFTRFSFYKELAVNCIHRLRVSFQG